jgi:hypothetical protein
MIDGAGAQRQRRCNLSWSRSSSRALRNSGTCAWGERWGEAAWHRRSSGKQRWCGGDSLPEEGNSGGADKMHGEGPFYSCASRRCNADLHKERGREVMAQLGGRASVRSCGAERNEGSNGKAGMEVMLKGVSSVCRWRGGELHWGRINATTWHTRACQRTLAMRLRACASRVMPGSRRCAFDRVSSASGVGGVRLRHRAPGAASRLEQRRAAPEQWRSDDGTTHAPHPTRRLKAAGAHMGLLVARGGDGWSAHRREFGR